MAHTPYLIIGGGMTGAAAANGIRELDRNGAITIVSAEVHRPYDRPPLSKKLWDDKMTVDDIFVDLPEGIDLRLGRRIVALDGDKREATDDQGETYEYDRLLLATGGTPRRLPFGGDAVNYYRTLDDYRALRSDAGQGASFIVIGGGFIGSEVAASLCKQGNQVTIIFPEAGICERIFPADMAAFLNDYYREHGVNVLNGENVENIEPDGDRSAVITGSGRRLSADRIVAGIGIIPNIELAEAAGLETERGAIVVDDHLRTSRPEIFSAGDPANYPDPNLDMRRRVEHADAARAMGRLAGRNMTGAGQTYSYLPMFYSDLFDLGYEAVGNLDSRLELIEDWQEQYRKGVIYYMKEGRVVGVLLMDTWDKLDEARALIESGRQETRASLLGRIR